MAVAVDRTERRGHARAGFRPDVEGLRAVAIALVVLYHFQLGGVDGGNAGVDVFFVISGFVITAMLLRERARDDRTSLAEFYARRARRILPAATAAIVATLVAARLVMVGRAVPSVVGDGRAAALFAANVRLAGSAGRLHQLTGARTPFGQFWSLSIEEQFYFVWPTLFLGVCALAGAHRRRVLAAVLGTIFVASSTLSIVWTPSNRNAAYFSSFTRAGELAAGALVAVALPVLGRLRPAAGVALSWVGLAAIVAAGLLIRDQHVYPGWLVLVPVLATVAAIAGGTVAGRQGAQLVLGARPLTALGARSYALYLWHFPIITLAEDRLGTQSVPDRLGWLALALVVAAASYRWLEDPVRRNEWLRTRRAASLALGVGLVALGVSTSLVVGASP